MTIKVRKLTRRDRATLTEIIKKFANITGADSLVSMATTSADTASEEGENTETTSEGIADILETAFSLLEQMLNVVEDDMAKWFCELIEVTRDEYDDLGFDIETEIIEQILSQKGFTDFFSRGSRIVKKIKTLANPSKS